MSNFYSPHRNSFGSLANIARYGENQHSTTIAVYSREDQELLVRSIVAAQKSQLPSPGRRMTSMMNNSGRDSCRQACYMRDLHYSRGAGSGSSQKGDYSERLDPVRWINIRGSSKRCPD